MAQLAHPERGGVVILNPPRKGRCWCWTLNNATAEEVTHILDSLPETKYCFQEEQGENGTPHLQGVARWENAISFASAKRAIGERAHIEPCRSWKNSVAYCSKTETRVGRIWHNIAGLNPLMLPDIRLNEWEERLYRLSQAPAEDRRIIWVLDRVGGRGKTTFCRWLLLKHPKSYTYVYGRATDVAYAMRSRIDEGVSDPHTVLFDLPRDVEGMSYHAIEMVKNGLIFSPKYESTTLLFNICHVIVFANFAPRMGALSEDRIELISLG